MISEGLAIYLQSRGFGSYRDVDNPIVSSVGIFIDAMPSSPAQAICITEYGGMDADSKLPWDEPRIQFRVRGTEDPLVSRSVAQQIYDLFHGMGVTDLPDGSHIQLMRGLHAGPVYLGIDSTGRRHEHVVNFEVTVFNPNRRG